MMNELISEEQFYDNIDIWAQIHPREAVMLPYVDCDHLHFFKNEKGALQLKQVFQFKTVQFCSIEDLKNQCQLFDFNQINVLFVYGVGLGEITLVLEEWLKTSREHHLVFLEDDLAVVHRLFETRLGAAILKNKQVHLQFFRDLSDVEKIVNQLFWKFPMQNLEFICSKLPRTDQTSQIDQTDQGDPTEKADQGGQTDQGDPTEKADQGGQTDQGDQTVFSRFNDLKHQIMYEISLKNDILSEYLDCGLSFFHNFYHNILKLPKANLGNALFGKFNHIPAIICGAGPSLKKNIEQLKALKGKGIIFGGSSSLNALISAGIIPDLGAAIDPNIAQEERLKSVSASTIDFPVFYRNRLYPTALDLIKGPRLYITGSGGYDVAEWFEQELGIIGKTVEEGNNVINFCLEIAHAMGCQPIIFVGMDLAFTGMESYASGVIENEKMTVEDLNRERDLVCRIDINGEPVNTLWKWIAESNWIGDFAKKKSDIKIYNATEGGIGFPGVENWTLKDVSDHCLQNFYHIDHLIKQAIKEGELVNVTEDHVREVLGELRKSLVKSSDLLKILIEESLSLNIGLNTPLNTPLKTPSQLNISSQSNRAILAETELLEEIAFKAVLHTFSVVQERLLERERDYLTKREIDLKLYQFLVKVAKVNLDLIDLVLD